MKVPGEFELIARLCRGLSFSRRVLLGPGDDCAVVASSRRPQLATIDSMVEGVHFKLSWMTPQMLGARALAVNLSDIAAMGGAPQTCLVNLGVREGLGLSFYQRLYAGLRGCAQTYTCDLVGGNITRAAQLTITIALLGETGPEVLRRDAAREGHEIFVTGTVGDAALGWRILAGEVAARGRVRRELVDRFRAPTPRLAAGHKLARIRPAAAAIDLSDGLLQDLGHILGASQVGAIIDLERLPLSDSYRQVAGERLELALSGGEDYELLFCLPQGHSERRLERTLGVPVRRIGQIVGPRAGLRLRIPGGALLRPTGLRGWDQLRDQRQSGS